MAALKLSSELWQLRPQDWVTQWVSQAWEKRGRGERRAPSRELGAGAGPGLWVSFSTTVLWSPTIARAPFLCHAVGAYFSEWFLGRAILAFAFHIRKLIETDKKFVGSKWQGPGLGGWSFVPTAKSRLCHLSLWVSV